MRFAKSVQLAVGIATWVLTCTNVPAAQTNVAVAANFTEAAKEIAAAFKQKTGHDAVLSFGATGQFYTQITQGAPFEVFLAADEARPKKAVDDGFAVPESRSPTPSASSCCGARTPTSVKGEETLKSGSVRQIGDLQSGRRALWRRGRRNAEGAQPLRKTASRSSSRAKLSRRRSSSSTPATPSLVSSLCRRSRETSAGSRWIVPQNLYTPIRQDAVLLKKGADNAAATAFFAFLKGPEARAIIEKYGYAVDAGSR